MPSVTISLSALHRAANFRPPGYVEAVCRAGLIDGEFITIEEGRYEGLKALFRPRGAGDLVAGVAKPIAELIGYDPSCAGCEQRREALNQLIPFHDTPHQHD